MNLLELFNNLTDEEKEEFINLIIKEINKKNVGMTTLICDKKNKTTTSKKERSENVCNIMDPKKLQN